MHQAAIDFFRLLVQAGAVPGEDFSCDSEQQAYHLNERCYHLLQEAYPDMDWQTVLGTPQTLIPERISQLHQRLGCPFVDNLLPRLISRLRTLPEEQVAGYVQTLLTGVESATGIPLYPLLAEQLEMVEQVRLAWLLRQEVVAIPGNECLLDLISAAGGAPADYGIHQGEFWLTETGRQRLFLVWDGDCTLKPVTPEQLS